MKRKTILLCTFVLISLLLVQLLVGATKEFRVEETEFVKISVDAVDEDNDSITIKYFPPLDAAGEWQTSYGDAGEYSTKIEVSDGKDTSVEEFHIIVKNKNQQPYLAKNTVKFEEGELIDLSTLFKDEDGDVLEVTYSSPFDTKGTWTPSYDDAGEFVTTVTASDGELSLTKKISVIVTNANQPPVLSSVFSTDETLSYTEGKSVDVWVEATDPDGNSSVEYEWILDGKIISRKNKETIDFNYEDSGKHTLILNVDDDEDTTTQMWQIDVQNSNRKPQFENSYYTIKEGEVLKINVSEEDLDGDELTYTFPTPLTKNGEWKTNFNDAGTYTYTVTGSDKDLSSSFEVKVEVENVDRSPILSLPARMYINEGDTRNLEINVSDPDQDIVSLRLVNAPRGISLEGKSLRYEVPYDTVARRGGAISNFLNTLRVERFFLKERDFAVDIEACAKDLCTQSTMIATVYNVNRGPEYTNFKHPPIRELDLVNLPYHIKAEDPDGDIVHYSYTNPASTRKGTWQTDYESEGNTTIYITATDGTIGNTRPLTITVLKNNRAPSISVQHDEIVVNEGNEFSFLVSATDPDNDDLVIALDNPPKGSSFSEERFSWTPPYSTVLNKSDSIRNNVVSGSMYLNKKLSTEKSVIWLTFNVTDGEVSTIHPVKIVVKNVNQAPVVKDFSPLKDISVHVNEPALFSVLPNDPDGDDVEISWHFGLRESSIVGPSAIERVYVAPGVKTVTAKITDGRHTTTKTWRVLVTDQIYQEPSLDVSTYKVYVIDT